MNHSDVRPAREFALNYGCKAVVYGGPGTGKTPICATTSGRALLLISEPGMMSMRKHDTPTYAAFTPAKIDDFMPWWLTSHEAKSNYDSLVWDSVSQSAEQKVEEELGGSSKAGNEQHGQRAYGKANRWLMEHLNKLYFQPQRHIVLITKMQNLEINGGIYRRPYFPGRELPIRVPHLFDFVLQLGNFNVPGVTPSPTRAFMCHEQFDTMARDRSGTFLMYEPPNLAALFKKAMA